MEPMERRLVLEHLAKSRERLLQAVDGLSAEQRSFQPADDRWSAAGCVEHIILVEDFVFQTMHRVLQAPPEPAKQADVRRKDSIVIAKIPARTSRVMGPEMVHPKNRWPDFEELLRQFESTRERSVTFAAGTEADLRSHFFPHPFLGDLDCYQWLLFLGLHCERHVRQLEEVKADPGFPNGGLGAGG
jgi:DinB superfamily